MICLVLAFRERCREKLEHLGDVAADTRRFDDAIIPYSAALSLHPPVPHVVVKRSKVYLAKRLWEDARRDARLVCPLRIGWLVYINVDLLGHNASIIFMERREGVDGVGKSKFDEWFVGGSDCCRS